MQISCYFDANNGQLCLITMKSSKFSYSLNLRIQSVIEKKPEILINLLGTGLTKSMMILFL